MSLSQWGGAVGWGGGGAGWRSTTGRGPGGPEMLVVSRWLQHVPWCTLTRSPKLPKPLGSPKGAPGHGIGPWKILATPPWKNQTSKGAQKSPHLPSPPPRGCVETRRSWAHLPGQGSRRTVLMGAPTPENPSGHPRAWHAPSDWQLFELAIPACDGSQALTGPSLALLT